MEINENLELQEYMTEASAGPPMIFSCCFMVSTTRVASKGATGESPRTILCNL